MLLPERKYKEPREGQFNPKSYCFYLPDSFLCLYSSIPTAANRLFSASCMSTGA